jgi:hypothetical protein
MKTQRRKGTMKMAAEGALKLLEVQFVIIVRYTIQAHYFENLFFQIRFARISVERKASLILLLCYS